MYLIESRNAEGRLTRHHWISVAQKWTEEKCHASIHGERGLATVFPEWNHDVRPVTSEEVAFAQRQGWL